MWDWADQNIEALAILIGPVAALVALWLLFWLLARAVQGAVALLNWALEQEFIGIVAYALAWVLLLPLMLVASIIFGIIIHFSGAEPKHKARTKVDARPLTDADEKYKWANRLPPYDK